MIAQDTTAFHRSRLEAEMARARAAVEAGADHARRTGGTMPKSDPEDLEARLWAQGGYWAMLFCIWFVFLAPIALLLSVWD
ncbi:hypothetical protein [Jannaschia sp. M317]|uniref:hypothetical protein n=1 Tax=Jannaschia sp. M317 TaxID=2867011 RepID=UPI0021A328E4|nr:hypothetical protein [Jannaschia sp. M317]UWQ17425.1 hypothetical protein K3551_16315 [Jannaschia sp. M317]